MAIILSIFFALLSFSSLRAAWAGETTAGNDGEILDIPYTTGQWDAALLGNHRAVISVSVKTDAAALHIPWRRRDLAPEKKNIIIIADTVGWNSEPLPSITPLFDAVMPYAMVKRARERG